jgi:hypothetical protein
MERKPVVHYANSYHESVKIYADFDILPLKKATTSEKKSKEFGGEGGVAASAATEVPGFNIQASGKKHQEKSLSKEYEASEEAGTSKGAETPSIEPTAILDPFKHMCLSGVRFSTIITQSGKLVCNNVPMDHNCSIIIDENGRFTSSEPLRWRWLHKREDVFTDLDNEVHKHKVGLNIFYLCEHVMQYDFKLGLA